MFSESYYQITLTFSEIMLHSKHFRIKLLLILQANFRSILPNNLSDLSLFFSTGIVTSSVFFSEFFGHKLGLASQKMNMVNTFAMVQSSKISRVGIYYQKTNLFQPFSKQRLYTQLILSCTLFQAASIYLQYKE